MMDITPSSGSIVFTVTVNEGSVIQHKNRPGEQGTKQKTQT